MKVFISQPMSGLTDDEILSKRNKIKKFLEEVYNWEVIDSYIEEEGNPVYLLGKSIELLSQADRIFMVKGWQNSRGCKIEYEVAKAYDIGIIEEINL